MPKNASSRRPAASSGPRTAAAAPAPASAVRAGSSAAGTGRRPFCDRACLLSALALITACVAAFAPALRGGLVWDDRALVESDPRIQSLGNFGQVWAGPFVPTQVYSLGNSYYRPLTTLSLMLDYARGGTAPAPYHQTNLFLHVLGTLAAFLLLRRWLGGVWAPLIAALLFAVHPSHTENVCWIAGRTDLLAGLFLFVAFLLFQIAHEDGRRWAIPAALGSFLLALFAKESALILPALLALQVLLSSREDGAAARLRLAAARTAPFFALAAAYLLLLWRMGSFGGPRPHAFTGAAHLLYVLQTLARYDALALWPHGFSLVVSALLTEGIRSHPLPSGALATAGVVAAALATLSAWGWARRRNPRLAFCLAAWPVALLPALNLVTLPTVAALRLLYVPLVFLVAALALLWRDLVARLAPGRVTRGALGAGLPLVIVAAWGAVAFAHCLPWRSEAAFWAYHLGNAPKAGNVQFFNGAARLQQGQATAALPFLERAVAISPDNSLYLMYCGSALLDQRQYARAEQVFRHALQVDPGDGTPANGLGAALAGQGRLPEAVRMFQEALAVSPGNPGFHADLGFALLRQQQTAGAVRELETALRIDARYVPAYGWLALAYDTAGQRDRALATVRRGLALAPGDPGLRGILDQITGSAPGR